MFAEAMIMIVAIFLVAVAAIGVECYQGKTEWSDNNTRNNNKNFMIFSIVFGILALFGAGAMMYMQGKAQGATNYVKTLQNKLQNGKV
jgi:hypothetical protein